MKTKKIIKEIEKRMVGVALERNKLDEAIAEATHLRENCDEAWAYLQSARDALSELV